MKLMGFLHMWLLGHCEGGFTPCSTKLFLWAYIFSFLIFFPLFLFICLFVLHFSTVISVCYINDSCQTHTWALISSNWVYVLCRHGSVCESYARGDEEERGEQGWRQNGALRRWYRNSVLSTWNVSQCCVYVLAQIVSLAFVSQIHIKAYVNLDRVGIWWKGESGLEAVYHYHTVPVLHLPAHEWGVLLYLQCCLHILLLSWSVAVVTFIIFRMMEKFVHIKSDMFDGVHIHVWIKVSSIFCVKVARSILHGNRWKKYKENILSALLRLAWSSVWTWRFVKANCTSLYFNVFPVSLEKPLHFHGQELYMF